MDVEERRKERMTPRRSAGHVGLILAALVALLRVNGVKAVDGTHITTTTPKNGPLSGGQSLTLSGQEFGAYSDQQHVRLGGSAVSATAWVSATSIVVTVPNGISMQKTVVLTMPGSRQYSLTGAFTYDQTKVSSIKASNRNQPAEGSAHVTVHGFNFGGAGYSGQARLGSGCETTLWNADTQLACQIAAGVGRVVPAVFTLAENTATVRPSTLTNAVTYDAPMMQSYIFRPTGQPTPYNKPQASGGQSLSVHGANFGKARYSIKSRFGGTGAEATIWIADSALFVRVASGVASLLTTVLTIAVTGRGTAAKSFSFGAPEVTGRIPNVEGPSISPGNAPTSGGVNGTISGFNFGANSYSPAGRMGVSAAATTDWFSDSRVQGLIVAGVCLELDTIVTVSAQRGTQTRSFSYDHPEPINGTVDSAINSPSTGAMTLTLTGINFGQSRYSGKARHHFTAEEFSNWHSDTSIFYKTPAGVGMDLTGVFTVCAGYGTATKLYSYDMPTVSMPVQGNGATMGGSTITLLGSGFGTAGYSPAAGIGVQNATEELAIGVNASATACEATRWASDTSSLCRTAAGIGRHMGGVYTVAMQVGTQSELVRFSYDVPLITAAMQANGPTGGGTNVTLEYGGTTGFHSITMFGQDFANHDYSGRAKLHDTDCMATLWSSATSLECRIPAGECVARSLAFTVGVGDFNNRSHFGTAIGLFSYDAPAVSGIENGTSPSSGEATIRLVGKNFGSQGAVDYTSMVRIGETTANVTAWYSDTYIAGLTPPGVGKDLSASLIVCEQEGTITGVFSYYPPNVTDVAGGLEADVLGAVPTRAMAAQTGGSTLNISGTDFGMNGDYSRAGRFGGTGAEATEWTSDTFILCKVARGVCGMLETVMTIQDNHGGTKADSLDYDLPYVTEGVTVSDQGEFENTFMNRPASGGTTISMNGMNFGQSGYSPAARLISNVNGTACEATTWVSLTSASCRVPSGLLDTISVELTVCAQIAGFNGTHFSYDAPVVTGASGGTNGPTSGASSITILGMNFGTVDYSNSIAIFGTNETYPGAYTTTAVTDWVSDSSLRAQVPPGIGRGLNVTIVFNNSALAGTLSLVFTYDNPVISSITMPNAPTEGGTSVTVSGSNFGTVDFNMNDATVMNISVAKFGGTSAASTLWTSDTALVAVAATGVCDAHWLSLTLATLAGTATEIFSYDTPTLTWNTALGLFNAALADAGDGTGRPNAAAAGGRNVTIGGQNFGPGYYSGQGRIGQTSPLMTSWYNDTAIIGLVPPGVCSSLEVTVSVCDFVGTATKVFSYDAPLVIVNETAHLEYSSEVNAPTTGGGSLSVSGSDFGTADYSSKLRLTFTAGETTMWGSDTALKIKVPAGERATLSMIASVCEQVGSSPFSFYQYDIPAISSIKNNGPTSGQHSLSLLGQNFGSQGYTPVASLGNNASSYGATACETTSWQSDSLVHCRTPGGVSHLVGVTFTLGVQVGTASMLFSYDAPAPTGLASNVPGTGKIVMLLTGTNFGGAEYSDGARIGNSAAEATMWVAETTMSIKIASGTKIAHNAVLTVAGGSSIIDPQQYGTGTKLFSYDKPSVVQIKYPFGRPNGATSGGHTTTLRGSNFGDVPYSARARLGASAASSTTWVSDSAVAVTTISGCGEASAAVTVCKFVGTASQMYSYDAPRVSNLRASRANSPTTGGLSSLTVSGRDFATFVDSSRVRVGDTAAEASSWVSETTIKARNAAGICTSAIAVSVCLKKGTLTKVFSYDKPMLTKMTTTAANSAVLGGQMATTRGVSLGTAGYSGQVRVGGTATLATLWIADSSVAGRVGAGVGGSHKIVFTLCSLQGSLSQAFTFDKPVPVKLAAPANQPTTAGKTVTLAGANFGGFDASPKTILGGTAAAATFWHSASSLAALPAPGVGKGLTVVALLGTEEPSRYGTLTAALSYDDNMLTALAGRNSPATGGATITFFGTNFGQQDYSGVAKLNPTKCKHSEWTADSAVRCLTPAGMCQGVSAVFTIAGSTSSLVAAFTFDAPSASSIATSNGGTSGGYSLTLAGANFGTASFSPTTTLVGIVGMSAMTEWSSDTSLYITAPLGGGVGLDVVVELCAMRRDTLSNAFSFDAPLLSSISRTIARGAPFFGEVFVGNAPQLGGALVTMLGANMGGVDLSPRARFGDTAASSSLWMSVSSLRVKTSPGMGHGHAVVLTVGTQIATLTETYSFDAALITSVSPRHAPRGATVAVLGTGLGNYDATPTILLGDTACESARWQSSSSLSCLVPPGVGYTLDISASSAKDSRLVTLVGAAGYAAPVVTGATPATGPQSGEAVLTVLGSRFGTFDASVHARVGNTDCVANVWTSDSSLTCKTPYGVGRVAVVVNESQSVGIDNVGVLPSAYAYSGPFPSSVNRTNAPFAGGATLTVTGDAFGREDQPLAADSLTIQVGESSCTTTTWLSATSAACVVSAGIGASLDLTLHLAGASHALSSAFTYDGFFVSPSFSTNGPTSGGAAIVMVGQELGTASSPPAVSFGVFAAKVAWTSSTSITATLPAGLQDIDGSDVTINAGRPMTIASHFSYDAPRVTLVSPTFGEKAGGLRVTATGQGFGGVSNLANVSIGGRDCRTTAWVSDSSLRCETPRAAKYGPADLVYRHEALRGSTPAEALALHPGSSALKQAAFMYREYVGPAVSEAKATSVTFTGTSSPAAEVALADGTKVEMPEGAFEIPVVFNLKRQTVYTAVVPSETSGQTLGSDIFTFDIRDENGVAVVPSKPLAITLKAGFQRRALPPLPPTGSSPPSGSSLSARSSLSLAGAPGRSALVQRAREQGLPHSEESAGEGGGRQLLQAAPELYVLGAWLDKCNGEWKAICTTKFDKTTSQVTGTIPVTVFSDSCFNPSSGCSGAITDADQCEGGGGSVVAMGFLEDPCPAEEGAVSLWVIILVSVGGGLMLLACLVLLCRCATREEEWDDEEYGSSQDSRSSSFNRERSGASGELVFVSRTGSDTRGLGRGTLGAKGLVATSPVGPGPMAYGQGQGYAQGQPDAGYPSQQLLPSYDPYSQQQQQQQWGEQQQGYEQQQQQGYPSQQQPSYDPYSQQYR